MRKTSQVVQRLRTVWSGDRHRTKRIRKEEEVMRNRTSWIMVLLGLLLALALVPAASAQGNALVRVVHASPDAPAVDVYVDGNKVLSNVPFFTASDYLPLPAGEH